ncbi:beta-L-arabinofuranosidase domain-containing protein [Dinghuibacter silviterrae]|uniref:DUF1680 family protein n=1 Tax=Dinghuibacter silviterrae TaxID=1539049 RepID=A0A4R8DUA3_9BACT|nr:beta-L-arabinofuranosidase domain-containing protein [Dinghuibacter silviterrae]TDX01496.1 DUF1680 family protein [Dinghuibacter silviterrae]
MKHIFLLFAFAAAVICAGTIAQAQTTPAQSAATAQPAHQAVRRQSPTVVTVVSRPPTTTTNAFYTSNRAPLAPSSFIKLPVGSVSPNGWLKRYLELQRAGLTGHLAEISAWLEKKDNAWYSGTGQGDHGWEEVPYWLNGYGDLAYLLKDPKMIATVKDWLGKVFESQRADGYFGPAPSKDRPMPDLWPNMRMLWCIQAYYEYSGDKRVLDFMARYFRWEAGVPDKDLLKTYWENSRGGDNLYSIYWLYNITGESWLLDVAEKIHRNTANWTQDGKLPNWHNVNVAQSFREPATYFLQNHDSALMNATYKDFYLIRALYGQVPGGMFGADENARPGYTDPRQAVETCGMVEQMASDELLMGFTGDPMWGDNCEDVAFNTYPAAVMPDFRGLRYLTAPNMVVSDSMNHAPGLQNDGPFLMMNPFSSRCCQHNHTYGWPFYAEHLWMATPDNGVAALLYSAARIKAKVGKGEMATFEVKTHYPFSENIRITVTAHQRFPLYLRVPGWCEGATVSINGQRQNATTSPDTYLRIDRTWHPGDVVDLTLPMQVTTHTWDKNANSVSVNYGPLTFSLKIKEDYKKVDSKASAIGDSKWQASADASQWPAYEILPGSAWNYALSDVQPGDFRVVKRPWPEDNFPFTPSAVPIELTAKVQQIATWTIDKYGLCGVLPQSPVQTAAPVEELTLIPMGAARLRISAFPVAAGTTATSWRRWSSAKANAWYAHWPWLRGSNFTPSTAINQLEMWQAETFDTTTIDRELGYAEGIGFNAMRVFLHHLAWQEDPEGFKQRVSQYLAIADRHHIGTIFVFFDDCWNPVPHTGKQPAPRPGIHNSGWVQDPGFAVHQDSAGLYPILERYVKDILTTFKTDTRIVLWDLYNEPGGSNYGDSSLALLQHVFTWGREINPDQPLSAGVWDNHQKPLCEYQLDASDVITYHNYGSPEDQQHEIDSLKKYGRPVICTEYMARTRGSLFTNIMPVLKKNNVAAINWGLVSGKTNTIYAWGTPMPDGSEPKIWFHDVFRKDGTPFSTEEVTLIKSLTGK